MRFLEQEIQLSNSKTTVNENYISTIYSETETNGAKKTQLIEKKIALETFSYGSLNFEARITTKLNKLELNSLLKKQEALSKKIAFLTKDVHLKLNNRAEIIEILNHKNIIENWHHLKSKLEKRHKGNHADKYFKGIEKRIKNHDSLLQNFRQLKGFGSIWFVPSGIYKEGYTYNFKRIIDNMISNLPIAIDETHTLASLNDNEIKFKISGSLSEEQKHKNKIAYYFKSMSNDPNISFKLDCYTGSCAYDIKTGLVNNLQLDIKSNCNPTYKKIQNFSLIKCEY